MWGEPVSWTSALPRDASVSIEARGRTARANILPFWGLLLFFVLIYAAPGEWIAALSPFQLAKWVAILSLVALLLVKTRVREPLFLTAPETLLLLTFIAVCGISALEALWKQLAAATFLESAKFVIIYLLIINVLLDLERLRQSLWVMVLGGLFPALGTIYRFISKTALVEGYRGAWVGPFGDPNEMAYSLIVLVPLLWLLFQREKRGIARLLLMGVLGAYLLAIYVSFSRGALVSMGVVFLLLVLRSRQKIPALALAGVILIGAVAWAPARYWERAWSIVEFQRDDSAMGRIYAWETGLAILRDRPLFGAGIGCYILAWPLYAPPEAGKFWRAPHNTLVEVLGETGLVGASLFGALLLTTVRDLRRIRRKDGPRMDGTNRAASSTGTGSADLSQFASAIEVALWGFIASGLTLGLARSWFFYILLGLAVSLVRLSRPVRPGGSPREARDLAGAGKGEVRGSAIPRVSLERGTM